jgi:ligand-binding sensor domain-containing protein
MFRLDVNNSRQATHNFFLSAFMRFPSIICRRQCLVIVVFGSIFLGSFITIPIYAVAEPLFLTKHIGRADGLPSNTVEFITRDRQGMFWMLTNNAICRYDGYKISLLAPPPPALTASSKMNFLQSLTCIAQDSSGTMWFGSQQGAFRFSPRTGVWEWLKLLKNKQNNYVVYMHCDSRGQMWFSTQTVYFRYDNATNRCVEAFPHIHYDEGGTAILENTNGVLWFGMDDKQLLSYNIHSKAIVVGEPPMCKNGFYTQFLHTAHGVWISPLNAKKTILSPILVNIDTATKAFVCQASSQIASEQELYGIDVYPFGADTQRGWYARVLDYLGGRCEAGLYYFKQPILAKPYQTSYSKHTQSVHSSAHNPFREPLLRGRVKTSYFDHQTGIMAVCIYERGVTLFLPTNAERLTQRSAIGDIICALSDTKGRVWCGTRKGLFVREYTGQDFTPVSTSFGTTTSARNSSLGTAVYDIQQTSTGTILVGTAEGLAFYNEKSRSLRYSSALQSLIGTTYLRKICPDPYSSELWLSAPSVGLLRTHSDGSVIEYFPFGNSNDTTVTGLGISSLANMTFDAEGNLWLSDFGAFFRRHRRAGLIERVAHLPMLEEEYLFSINFQTLLPTKNLATSSATSSTTTNGAAQNYTSNLTKSAPVLTNTLLGAVFGIGFITINAQIPMLTDSLLRQYSRFLPINAAIRDKHIVTFRNVDKNLWWRTRTNAVYRASVLKESGQPTHILADYDTLKYRIEQFLPGEEQSTQVQINDSTQTLNNIASGSVLMSDVQGNIIFDYFGELVAVRPEVRAFADTAHIVPIAYFRNDTLQAYTPYHGDRLQCLSGGSFSFVCGVAALHRPERHCIEYKLEGIDNAWNLMPDASLRTIRYSSLPPGEYLLRIRTRTNDDAPSRTLIQEAGSSKVGSSETGSSETVLSANTLEYTITVPYPWWRHPISLGAFSLVLSFLFISIGYFAEQRRRRAADLKKEAELMQERLERENAEAQRRAAEFHLSTLQLQMNPHFLFNTMTILQEMVMTGNEFASEYIVVFAQHLRGILEESGKPYISISAELDILKKYIALEELRHKNQLKCYITMERQTHEQEQDEEEIFNDNTDAEYWQEREIPPFILQPFIENAIRHGIRPFLKQDADKQRMGLITLHIKDEGTHILCVIEDNGIGRAAAGKLQEKRHTKHQIMHLSPNILLSKPHLAIATTITKERLRLLQEAFGIKLGIHYDDLMTNEQEAAGTRVTLRIPVKKL